MSERRAKRVQHCTLFARLSLNRWENGRAGKAFFREDHVNPLYGAQIAAAFGQEYKKLRELEPEPDMIFHKLQHFTGDQEYGTPTYQAAVLAVLAYFFEQCDIYERPSHEVTL